MLFYLRVSSSVNICARAYITKYVCDKRMKKTLCNSMHASHFPLPARATQEKKDAARVEVGKRQPAMRGPRSLNPG